MIRDDQINKLSDLFLDIAKGIFIAAFVIQIFTKFDILVFVRNVAIASVSTFVSLKILEYKKGGKK